MIALLTTQSEVKEYSRLIRQHKKAVATGNEILLDATAIQLKLRGWL